MLAFRPRARFVVPAPDGTTVDVGPGCKWEDVYAALQPLGKTAVGGRLGDVGVVGFLLGGGLSYLSAQHGLACDNVVSFECVLADGTVVTASRTSHPDLFLALRGGGNQFAVVTRMTLRTHDVGDGGRVWGGIRTYAADQHAALLSAVSNFTAANGRHPRAALIPNFNFLAGLGLNLPFAFFFFFYDGREPADGAFDAFDAIPHLTSGTATKTYAALTSEALGGDYKGLRFQIRTGTFPNMPLPPMTAFLADHFRHIAAATAAGARADVLDLRLLTYAPQPLSRALVQASLDAGGGNALGLVPEHGDRVWMEYDMAWANPLCDTKCPSFFRDTIDSARAIHENKYAGIAPTNYAEGDLSFLSYNPLFMNDAMADQKVLQSYGEDNYQRLKAIHQKYDPDDFFSTRQGGFKFTP
ncbi:hypothetical protein CDD83_7047 [Cordyceps sp. RAO-2017]|nr:hypothetical protein CDD83_7047 [Cordyceps sp. RAO-2017]